MTHDQPKVAKTAGLAAQAEFCLNSVFTVSKA